MLRGFVTSAVIGFARRKAGVPTIGTIPAALLTSGASLILTKGRRPVGVAVAALGGFLLWREVMREQEEIESALLPPASADASAATAPR